MTDIVPICDDPIEIGGAVAAIRDVMTHLTPIYIAHPLGVGPNRERNRHNAAQWVCFLASRYYVAPVCSWITLAEVWPETMRDVGLEIDKRLVDLVGLMFACGRVMSPGMRAESGWATDVIDVTRFCCEWPAKLAPSELEELDREMAGRGIARRP